MLSPTSSWTSFKAFNGLNYSWLVIGILSIWWWLMSPAASVPNRWCFQRKWALEEAQSESLPLREERRPGGSVVNPPNRASNSNISSSLARKYVRECSLGSDTLPSLDPCHWHCCGLITPGLLSHWHAIPPDYSCNGLSYLVFYCTYWIWNTLHALSSGPDFIEWVTQL